MQKRRPVMLVILDGWGWRDDAADNAVRQAKTPTFDRLWQTGPHGLLHTSGKDVGLPGGQMGNSEVGHLNIGAGRVVMQDLPRIGAAIADGEIERAPALVELIATLKQSGGTCHLVGLASPGGVHSHQDHAAALAKILAAAGVPTRLHAFTDGRDTPPQSAADDIKAPDGGAAGVGQDRHGVRPLFRDGPRQALGSRREGLPGNCRGRRSALCGRRRRHRRRLCQQHVRRVHRAGGGGRLCGHDGRRRGAVLQLPRRSGARDSRRHARSGFCRLPRGGAWSASPPPSA